ncbi:MAG: hypothetical protein J6I50_06620 [Clostridia bacterium]|nr:hypothetical protein [Clostridia bacterium]
MNVIRLLGWDTNQIYGGGLLLIALISFIFPFIYWKRNVAWKHNKGDKISFFEIWKPSSLMGTVIFTGLGLLFWFLDDIIACFRP